MPLAHDIAPQVPPVAQPPTTQQKPAPPMSQMPLEHVLLPEHPCPGASRQAVPAVSQVSVVGDAQLVVVPGLQVVRQAVPPPLQSRPLAQVVGLPGLQVPPLQVPAFAAVNWLPLHVALPQLPVG